MRISRSQIQALPFIILFLLFTACFIAYPLHIDDYWMMDGFNKGYRPEGNFFSGLKAFFETRYFHDTPRLSNFIILPFLYLPSWVIPVITSALLPVIYRQMCGLAGIKWTDFGGNAVMTFLLTFCFLWSASPLFTRDYHANYLWELPLMLWLVKRYLDARPLNVFAAFFMGLLLGIWHEAYAAPMVGAGVGVLLIKKEKIRRDRIWMILGLTAGIMWILTAPGTWMRAGLHVHTLFRLSVLAHLIYCVPGLFFFLALFFIGMSRPGMRPRVFSPLSWFVLFFCITSMGVMVTVDTARANNPGMIMGYIGVVYLLGGLIPRWIYTPDCRGRALWWTLLALAIAHMSAALSGIVEVNREDRAIRRIWAQHTQRPVVIFAEITDDVTRPWYHLRKSLFDYMPEGWHWKRFSEYMGLPLHDVVPYELKDFDLHMGQPVKGDAGAVFYKGRIVMPYTAGNKNVKVYYGKAVLRHKQAVFPGRDRNNLVYIMPYYRVWEPIVSPDSVVIVK